MPKMKTRRCAAKRFKVRSSGTVKCKHAKRRHLLEHKTRKMKRQARGSDSVDPRDVHRVYGQLPYA
ncbi:MAG: 50S ribosomal protein L35 [Deltaproteobacteria bacterium]|nr:50S ribosomal protein L35 [Deltaproteobacteria bacterium]